MLRDINEAVDPDIPFDQFSLLDPERARRQIETALDIQITPATMLSPARFQQVVEQAIEDVDEGGSPPWLPDGAVAFADFTAGHYYAGGAEVADVTTIFGSDVDAGTTFSAGDISVSGLAVASLPNFIGALNTDAVNGAGRTFLFEFTNNVEGSLQFFLVNAYAVFDVFYMATAVVSGNSSIVGADIDLSVSDQQTADGLNKVAFTISPTHFALSINGAVAASQAVMAPFAQIINAAMSTCDYQFLRTVTIYPVQDDADLAALTA